MQCVVDAGKGADLEIRVLVQQSPLKATSMNTVNSNRDCRASVVMHAVPSILLTFVQGEAARKDNLAVSFALILSRKLRRRS